MGSEVIILPVIFGVIFAIAYLYFSTRNKERLALIEKGADASIFVNGKTRTVPIWKIIILNLALLMIGIGVAIFLASFMANTIGVKEEVAYPGAIFLMAGVGLLVGFTMAKRLEQ